MKNNSMVLMSSNICPVCEKSMDKSVITDSYIIGFNHEGPLVITGLEHSVVHLHGVTISTKESLTIRFAIRRYIHTKRLWVSWKWKKFIRMLILIFDPKEWFNNGN